MSPVMTFQHPTTRYTESASVPVLWALLFGPLYFLFKGAWKHAILYTLLVLITTPTIILPVVIWVLYALAAGLVIKRTYLRNGWTIVEYKTRSRAA